MTTPEEEPHPVIALLDRITEGEPLRKALEAEGIDPQTLTVLRVDNPRLDVIITRIEADSLVAHAERRMNEADHADESVAAELIKMAKSLRGEAMALRKMADAKAQRYKIGNTQRETTPVPHLGLGHGGNT